MNSTNNSFQKILSSKLIMPATIYSFDEIDSTNEFLKKLKNENEPIIVISKKQSNGKGQNGKTFFSPINGLYFSFKFKHLFGINDLTLITSVAAVAVVESIEKITHVQSEIKWVNDILLNNKKIAGILTETKFSHNKVPYVIVGIGINVFPSKVGFPEKLLGKAGTIYDKPVPKDIFIELIAEIFNLFFYYYSNLPQKKHMNKYRKYSVLTNKEITFTQNNINYLAKVIGIDEDDNLIVNHNDKIIILSSGSISINIRNWKWAVKKSPTKNAEVIRLQRFFLELMIKNKYTNINYASIILHSSWNYHWTFCEIFDYIDISKYFLMKD